jgi:glucokinase
MALLGIDLGGTKLALAVLSEAGKILHKETVVLENRRGAEVGGLITNRIIQLVNANNDSINSIGISVPGIYYVKRGKVWAPNIPGWDDYPLLAEIKKVAGEIPVTIDSDRACYILGETWKGNSQQCLDAIYLAVGTGIGAGILNNGIVLRGSHDIAGAVGWMALSRPFNDEYIHCGCFETYASGEGIAKLAGKLLKEDENYSGELKNMPAMKITCHDVFRAYENADTLAVKVIETCIQFWGMAAANLVSLFNPEKIIFGGGVFGPAIKLIPAIKIEAAKWAQPISMKQVAFEASGLGTDAGVYGAGFLALKNIQ